MNKRISPFHSITVFGGATIDRIAATAAPPVPDASNPGHARATPGGVGLNIAAALARLGHPVRLVARVGADHDGEQIIAAAQAAGVDTTFVGVSSAAPTASYHAAFDDKGGLIIGISDMAICEEMTPAVVASAAAQSPPDDFWVVDSNLPPETLDFLVGETTAAERAIAAIAVSPAKVTRLGPLLDRLTLLFATRREGAALLGLPFDDRQPVATTLAGDIARKTTHVVITNSTDLVAVASAGEVRTLAPLKARVKSVNGAGDALAAGTIHGLAGGRTTFEAVISGLAAAAITVESDDTIVPELSPALLNARIGSGSGPVAAE